jgi:hypothetical protein
MEKSGFLMVGCFNDYFTSRFVWNVHLELVDVCAHLKWKCYETKNYEMKMIKWLTKILRSISHSNQRKKERNKEQNYHKEKNYGCY